MGLPAQDSLRPNVPADPLNTRASAVDGAPGAVPGTRLLDGARRERPSRREPTGPHFTGPGARARAEARSGLYVHVPFCAARCTYCDFSSGPVSAAAMERYVLALEREIELRAAGARGHVFHSVFFGGGTPSALPARLFHRAWDALAGAFAIDPAAEITVEANPESARDDRLEAWAECGVNRLSMGAQSFVAEELKALGRIHAAERPHAAMARARSFGFRRLSIDLMYGFPGHTMERWRHTMREALSLDLEHLSVYCFIPEPGTSLGDAVESGELSLPDEDAQADAYAWLVEELAASGYARYETSNFCREDGEARHNLVYWLRRPYLGLGPSAHGLWGGRRYGNAYAFDDWAARLEGGDAPESSSEPETPESRARETVMLGLRLGRGLAPRDHDPDRWSVVVRRYGRAFEGAVAAGRLERAGDTLRIPDALGFLADDVIAWIEARA